MTTTPEQRARFQWIIETTKKINAAGKHPELTAAIELLNRNTTEYSKACKSLTVFERYWCMMYGYSIDREELVRTYTPVTLEEFEMGTLSKYQMFIQAEYVDPIVFLPTLYHCLWFCKHDLDLVQVFTIELCKNKTIKHRDEFYQNIYDKIIEYK